MSVAPTGWREDPTVGMVIVERWPQHRHGRVPRRIITVKGDRVLTVGNSGSQRDRWMGRDRLRAYELVSAPVAERPGRG